MHPNHLPSSILYTSEEDWSRLCQQNRRLYISHESNLPPLFPQSVSHQVGGYRHSIDVGTPSALTPSDLPLDEYGLCPRRSPNLSVYSRERIFKHNALSPVSSWKGSEWETCSVQLDSAHPGLWDRLYLTGNWPKMLAAVMCVERNAPVLSLTELCKNDSVETFAWYSVRPQPPFANGKFIHTHTHTHTHHTHTQSQADPALRIF